MWIKGPWQERSGVVEKGSSQIRILFLFWHEDLGGGVFYFFKEPPSYGTYPKQREGTQKWQKAILAPNPKVRLQPELHLTKLLMPKGDQQPRKGSWGSVLQAHKARKGQERSWTFISLSNPLHQQSHCVSPAGRACQGFYSWNSDVAGFVLEEKWDHC